MRPLRRRRQINRSPSVAERQLALLNSRPVQLPQGADPELGTLFGIEAEDARC